MLSSIKAVNVRGMTYVRSSKAAPAGWAEEDILDEVIDLENGLRMESWEEYSGKGSSVASSG